MKEKLLGILLCGTIALSVAGCGKSEKVNKPTSDEVDKELLACLESELGGYLVQEEDTLVDIPLSEVKKNLDKIEYYKGVHASVHNENMYMIVVEKDKIFDADVMEDFKEYFKEKFPIYQSYEILTEGISIYIHNADNDVDFENIQNRCMKSSSSIEGKEMPTSVIDKIKDTKKILIKSGKNMLGTIADKKVLSEFLNNVSKSKLYGESFLCDGPGFAFELYDSKNELLETILVYGDGKRLIPKSISEGCAYYFITDEDYNLSELIEEQTDFKFYNLSGYEESNTTLEKEVYSDNKYRYYFDCKNSDEISINFRLTNQNMSLEYAIKNKYISAEKVHKDYPNILKRKNK